MNKLNLPKSKEIDGEVYPYISYSQYSSFNETSEEFRLQYILQYIFGIKMESRFQIYADYGSAAGEYVEDKSKKENVLLNDNDKKILNNYIKSLPNDCEYEREVWIERDGYSILGFEDIFYQDGGEGIEVVDLKTGSIAKKAGKYESLDYNQTNLYAYYENAVKGNKIKDCRVVMFDRVGNAMKDNPDELHLSGKIKDIPTPYTLERAEKFLKKVDETAKKISELNTTYQKLKELKVKF